MNRGLLRIALLVLAVFCGAGGSVWAAGDEKGILDPRFDLGIWTIFVFGLLYLVLRYVKLPGASAPAWSMMLEGLQKREERILAAAEEAKLARAETQRIQAEFQRKMDEAYAEIPKIMEEARRDAAVLKEEMRAATQTEIQTERQRLRREIEMARDQALQELWNQAAQLATLVASKAIRRQIQPDDHRRLVEEALAELGQAGKERRREVAGVQT